MTPEAVGFLLHNCSKIISLNHGQSLHAFAFKAGNLSDIVVSNHVLNMYAKCGDVVNARKMFDEMRDRNLVSWSAMISGYNQVGEHALAIQLFSKLHFVPNEYVFSSAISSCASLRNLVVGRQVHTWALKSGYSSVSFVANALISMYMGCGLCSDAVSVHREMLEPNVVSYNALISGFGANQQFERAYEMFQVMRQSGISPDRFTFSGVLGSCTGSGYLPMGASLHCLTIKCNLDCSAFVGNVIMTMYSSCNLIEEVEKVFRLIEEKDLISWNTFIAACSRCGDHGRALIAFVETLRELGMKPDDFTFASALAACAGLASLRHGKEIHARLTRTWQQLDMESNNALINMYAKCGSIRKAYHVFTRMGNHNLFSFNTMISAFANHGLGERAIELFEEMKLMRIQPDSVTFVGLLTACNHAGLVDEGEFFFKSLQEMYNISPDVEHFSCLIDLLGRAGRLHEAEEYIKKYPFAQDPVVLGCFLSACRLHGNMVIGERLAGLLLKLQPVTTSPYVLLANLYASDDMWKGVSKARKLLKVSGIKKEPGHSLIEIKGIIHKFKIGDHLCPETTEIKKVLEIFACEAGEDWLALLTGLIPGGWIDNCN